MKIAIILFIYCICSFSSVVAQQVVCGVVVLTNESDFSGVQVSIESQKIYTETNKIGQFWLEVKSKSSGILVFQKEGFQTERIEFEVFDQVLDLGEFILTPILKSKPQISRIILTDELLEDGERSNFTAGLFQSSKDEYLKAAAYNFSQTWFKLRGVDAAYSTFLINGVEMNKFSNGRPQWSNWGGLNDAFKNQTNSTGIAWSEKAFGSLLGVTSVSTRASEFKKFTKVSLASTNRSYQGRVMATHASGVNKNGFAYMVSGSGRYADQGYLDGTSYKSWAAFIAIEKQFDARNSLNFTGFVSSNIRGKSSPNTDEVYKLRDFKYNSYWGLQNGKLRNSRMKEVREPVLMLTYDFKGEKSSLSASLSYQFGAIRNGRLGYFKAENPDPTYYKKLPSYYLSNTNNPDYSNAYLAIKEMQINGQINWSEMYKANQTNGAAVYYLYDDVNADTNLGMNLLYDVKLNAGNRWISGLNYRQHTSKNYGEMQDLLGGTHFTDINQYGEGDGIQNDLNNPNKKVLVGDKFQYSYNLSARESKIFTQFESLQNRVEYFLAVEGVFFNTQRKGNFKNGSYKDNSFGKSEALSLSGYSFKGGVTYKYSGRHLFTLNAGMISRIPTLQNVFANQRVSNKLIPSIETEMILKGDINYRFRSSQFQGRFTGYFLNFKKGIESSFFFAQGILGDEADFVHEIITNVEKKNVGAELSLSYQLSDAVKLLGAGTYAQYKYANNPNLHIESESFPLEEVNFGKSYLKNIKQGNTPQRAYSLGFEYRDPKFWWFQVNGNYLSDNYLDVAPLLRTDNFYLDENGVPFTDETTGEQVSKEQVLNLLKQEAFPPVFLLNLVGGKSWRLNDSYVGFFMVVNNVLGEVFRSGGFEQGRKANYPELKEDKSLETPLFGPKYWYGSGTSYYFNMYYRF